MDPVTAFSLAAGVLQVIDLSVKAISKCREIYKNGSLAENQSTLEVTKHLSETTDSLNSSICKAGGQICQEDKDLIEVSTKCSALAGELQSELRKLQVSPKGNFGQAVGKGLRTLQRRNFIKGKQEKLEEYRRILDSRMLIRLRTYSCQQIRDIQRVDQTMRDLVNAVSNGHISAESLANKQTLDLQSHISQHFDKGMKIKVNIKAQQQFRDSLFYSEMFARQEDIYDYHEGTCKWILGLKELRGKSRRDRPWPSFTDWLSHGEGIYWLSGKPGSGKSTLMKYLTIETPKQIQKTQLSRSWSEDMQLLSVCFFFYNMGTALQKNHLGFLRSLLYQIASQRPEAIHGLTDSEENSASMLSDLSSNHLPIWTERRLLSVLKQVLASITASSAILIFIDGLDEFEGDEETLLDTIRFLSTFPNTKVCVSSRPEQILRTAFSECPQLKLQDLNHGDMEKAANSKLRPVLESRFPNDNEKISLLIDNLVSKAEGVFLWLDIIIKALRKGAYYGDDIYELYDSLHTIPSTIDGMYEHMWGQLDKRYQQEGIWYFRVILAYLHRCQFNTGLTLLEFAFGNIVVWQRLLNNDRCYLESSEVSVLCENLETRILTRCAGLVEVEERPQRSVSHVSRVYYDSNDIRIREGPARISQDLARHNREVKLVHKTVLEFLKDHPEVFCRESSWRSAPNLALARGRIAVASAISPPVQRSVGYTLITLAYLVHWAMTLVVDSAEIDAIDDATRQSREAGFEMVDQTFRIITSTDMRFNSGHDTWFQRSTEVELLNERNFGDSRLPRLPFHDCQGFAAFYGCYHYISRYLSAHSYFQSDFDYIASCALNGVRQMTYPIDHPPLTIGHFRMVQELLHRGMDPNLCYAVRVDKWVDDQKQASTWTDFIKSTAKQICAAHSLQIHRRKSGHRNLQLLARCVEIWEQTMECFLSHNSDVDASIYSIYKDPFELKADVALEESPCSYLERVFKSNEDHTPRLSHLLQSLFPSRKRFCRFIHFRSFDIEEDHPEIARRVCVSERWYPLSQEQSDTLDKNWPHTRGDQSEFRIIVERIKASVEEADRATTLDVERRKSLDWSDEDFGTDFESD